MTTLDHRPLARPLPPARARALPWISVIAASLTPAVPVIATVPLLPPFGLMLLLGWRLLARGALPLWSAAPLGFVDDLVSGQPLGSAMLLWSVSVLTIDLIEQRLHFRDFWQDWLIASGAISFCLFAGRYLALPLAAPVDPLIGVQLALSILLFPATARLIVGIDRRRGPA